MTQRWNLKNIFLLSSIFNFLVMLFKTPDWRRHIEFITTPKFKNKNIQALIWPLIRPSTLRQFLDTKGGTICLECFIYICIIYVNILIRVFHQTLHYCISSYTNEKINKNLCLNSTTFGNTNILSLSTKM